MAANRIEIMQIRQIIRLRQSGISNRKIADLIGIHRNSVNEYVRLLKACKQDLAALSALSDHELAILFPSTGTTNKDRYEALNSQFEYFRKELKKVGCTREILWKEYLEKYPDGYQYTQFNKHFNDWLKQVNGSGKLIHKAGDKVYVDYTGKKLHYIDKATGEVIEAEVFVAILPCSGYTYVHASSSQKQVDFIDSMANCLTYFGGVPQAIVTDNLKAAVHKSSKYQASVNRTFKDFALHYGTTVSPTRSYAPKDKALVEGAVKLVYQRIFYPLSKQSFFSLNALNQAIAEQLEQYNDYLLTLLQVSRRQQFISIEQTSLAPLPAEKFEIKTYKKATVQKMGYIFLSSEKNYYSVPYRFIGKKVTVCYTQHSVEVYHDHQRIASHKRSFQPGHYNTIEEHLSSTHQFYSEWSPAFFHKRAQAYGTDTTDYITALIAQKDYPELAYKQCLGIFALAKKYTKVRLNNACKRALLYHRYSYRTVKTILENKMDMTYQESINYPNTTQEIEEHENIRGADYFQ